MAKKKLSAEPEEITTEQTLEPEEQVTGAAAPKIDAVMEIAEGQMDAAADGMELGEQLPEEENPTQILSLDIVPLDPEPRETDAPSDIRPDESETKPTASEKAERPAEPAKAPDKRPVPEKSKAPKPAQQPSERQSFYGLDFNELDRDLSDEERQEWNSIYASYRGRSALIGTIIGADRHTVNVWNRQTEKMEQQEMYCAIVIPFRVRIVIPATEMWDSGQERPNYVLQNMVGASIDFVIVKVDREGGFAIASRRLAARSRRYFFSRRPALNTPKSRVKCRVLSVGPRRCLVECYGHDISLTQREMRYTAIPDLRTEYHPGEELDCIVKAYDPESGKLIISVKETKSNPFEGAELRHPVGSRRQAVIAGKYGGGVFCNLPDGTVCMCAYSFQYEDSQFQIGDTAIVVIQRYDMSKKQIYGKIISKW